MPHLLQVLEELAHLPQAPWIIMNPYFEVVDFPAFAACARCSETSQRSPSSSWTRCNFGTFNQQPKKPMVIQDAHTSRSRFKSTSSSSSSSIILFILLLIITNNNGTDNDSNSNKNNQQPAQKTAAAQMHRWLPSRGGGLGASEGFRRKIKKWT